MTDTVSARKRRNWWADAGAVGAGLLPLVMTAMFIQSLRIAANPATAPGAIYEKHVVESDGESVPVYRVRYSFRDASGREYRGQASVSSRIYDSASIGDGLEIQYAADDPDNNRVISETGDPEVLQYLFYGSWGLGVFVYLGPRRWLRMGREKDRLVT